MTSLRRSPSMQSFALQTSAPLLLSHSPEDQEQLTEGSIVALAPTNELAIPHHPQPPVESRTPPLPRMTAERCPERSAAGCCGISTTDTSAGINASIQTKACAHAGALAGTFNEAGLSNGDDAIQEKAQAPAADPESLEPEKLVPGGSLISIMQCESTKRKYASSSESSDPGDGSPIDATTSAALAQGNAAMSTQPATVTDGAGSVGKGRATSSTLVFADSTHPNGIDTDRKCRSSSNRKSERSVICQGRETTLPKVMTKECALEPAPSETTASAVSEKVSMFV
jgi:hypothetical protein